MNAFREVQDDLTALTVFIQAQQTQQQAVDAAKRTLDISTNRYTGGLVSYLDVVTAQQNLLNNEQELVTIQGQRLTTSVLLVKALGGGWDASSLAAIKVKAKLRDIVSPVTMIEFFCHFLHFHSHFLSSASSVGMNLTSTHGGFAAVSP